MGLVTHSSRFGLVMLALLLSSALVSSPALAATPVGTASQEQQEQQAGPDSEQVTVARAKSKRRSGRKKRKKDKEAQIEETNTEETKTEEAPIVEPAPAAPQAPERDVRFIDDASVRRTNHFLGAGKDAPKREDVVIEVQAAAEVIDAVPVEAEVPEEPAIIAEAPAPQTTLEDRLSLYGIFDIGRHTVLNSWPLFDSDVAAGTGKSSAMISLRLGGEWKSIPWLRLELGATVIPFESTTNQSNTAMLYTADANYLIRRLSSTLLRTEWTPVVDAGIGVYHNVRGDLGNDADMAFHLGLGVRGEINNRYRVRVSLRDYFTDYIKGEGPGNNLELSVGIEFVFFGASPEQEPERPHMGPEVVTIIDKDATREEEARARQRVAASIKRKQKEALGVLEGATLLFDFASAAITDQHDVILQKVAKQLRKQPGIRLVVVGFADSVGDGATNTALSLQRSQAVVTRLGQLGVDATRMLPAAAGEDSPFTSNNSDVERKENRRVEFHILNSDS